MTQEFVTLPREVVEKAIAAMQRAGEQRGSTASEVVAMEAMRAALEQSTDNHDWYQLGFHEGVVKGREELSAEYPLPADLYDSKDWRCGTYAERVEWLHTMYEDAKEQIAALEQPQGEQEPVAVVDFTTEGWRKIVDALRTLPDGAQLYTRPQNLQCKSTQARLATLWGYVKEQPKREPLTHYEIHELFRRSWDDCQDGDEIKAFARAIEAAHNIK